MKKIGFVIIAVIMATSCNKSSFKDVNTINSFDIKEAQYFFEEEYSNRVITRYSSTNKSFLSEGEFTPLWNKAKFCQNSTSDCFFIPIISEYKYRAIRNKLTNGKSAAYIVNIRQLLVIEKNNINSELTQYMLTLVPNKKQSFNRDMIQFVAKQDYSGLAIYCHDETIISIEEYDSGISVLSITDIDISNNNEINQASILMNILTEDIKFQYSNFNTQQGSFFENEEDEWIDLSIENSDDDMKEPSYAPSLK